MNKDDTSFLKTTLSNLVLYKGSRDSKSITFILRKFIQTILEIYSQNIFEFSETFYKIFLKTTSFFQNFITLDLYL